MSNVIVPKTYDEAVAMGYETGATVEEFQGALDFYEALRKLEKNTTGTFSAKPMKRVDCSVEPDNTVCVYVPCHNGWEYVSTCFEGVCKPGLRRRC